MWTWVDDYFYITQTRVDPWGRGQYEMALSVCAIHQVLLPQSFSNTWFKMVALRLNLGTKTIAV